MGRRSDHSREELQVLIIEATLNLVKEHGADRVTARQIAASVGYTPGMLYSVFINLQDIFLHVNQVGLRTLYQLCKNAQLESDTPADAIKAMGLTYLRFAEEHTHQFDLMFARHIQHPEVTPVELSNQIQVLFELIEGQLRLLNRTASETLLQQTARSLWSGVHGIAALRLSNQLYLEQAEADRNIMAILVTGIVQQWQAAR